LCERGVNKVTFPSYSELINDKKNQIRSRGHAAVLMNFLGWCGNHAALMGASAFKVQITSASIHTNSWLDRFRENAAWAFDRIQTEAGWAAPRQGQEELSDGLDLAAFLKVGGGRQQRLCKTLLPFAVWSQGGLQ
jgi:hypothetical protein